MKALILLSSLWTVTLAADIVLSAVKAKDGSMDVAVPNDGKTFNIPANVLTLATALLNEATSLVNAAQTKGTANLVVPIRNDNSLLVTSVAGTEYSLYIGTQLDGLLRAFDGFTSMIGAFSNTTYLKAG